MRKKILFLAAWYPTRYDPMPGLFVKRHAELLPGNYDVCVLHTLAVKDLTQKYELEIVTENDVYTVRVYHRAVSSKLWGISHILKFWRLFKSHQLGFREIKIHAGIPDLVHLNILTRVGIFALYLKIRYQVPYVITEHWSRYLPERGEYKGLARKVLTKLVVRNSSGISTVSERLKEAMVYSGIRHRNFKVIHNVTDESLFCPDDISQLSLSPPLVFAHISCFDNKAKNVLGLIRAIGNLTQKRKDFICLMVGDGPDKLAAEQLAISLGINDTFVQFTGLLEGSQLVQIYNRALFTVLFSNYENLPVVISESFACGRPVIATNTGGIPEIVNSSTGLLVLPGDEAGLTNAIDTMLDHYMEFDRAFIRNYALDQFGNSAIARQLIQLYQSVLGNSI